MIILILLINLFSQKSLAANFSLNDPTNSCVSESLKRQETSEDECDEELSDLQKNIISNIQNYIPVLQNVLPIQDLNAKANSLCSFIEQKYIYKLINYLFSEGAPMHNPFSPLAFIPIMNNDFEQIKISNSKNIFPVSQQKIELLKQIENLFKIQQCDHKTTATLMLGGCMGALSGAYSIDDYVNIFTSLFQVTGDNEDAKELVDKIKQYLAFKRRNNFSYDLKTTSNKNQQFCIRKDDQALYKNYKELMLYAREYYHSKNPEKNQHLKCYKLGARENVKCALKNFNIKNADKVIDLYEKYHISIVGFNLPSINFIESNYLKKYSLILNVLKDS